MKHYTGIDLKRVKEAMVVPAKDETKEDNPDNEGVVAVDDNADTTEKQEEVQPEAETQETPVLEEISNSSIYLPLFNSEI